MRDENKHLALMASIALFAIGAVSFGLDADIALATGSQTDCKVAILTVRERLTPEGPQREVLYIDELVCDSGLSGRPGEKTRFTRAQMNALRPGGGMTCNIDRSLVFHSKRIGKCEIRTNES